MDAGQNALARMVLVDVTWSDWRPETDQDRFEEILGRLVGLPAVPEPAVPEPSVPEPSAPGPSTTGPYGPVYVHQCDEEGRLDPSWVEPDAPYELPPPDECQCPDQWREGDEGQGWALDALRRQGEAQRNRPALTPREPDHRLLRTRVAMAADRFRAMAGCGGTADYWVLIDLRFQWISAGTTLWHTSFSVWSDLPWSHHCPAQVGARGPARSDRRPGP